MKRVLSALLAAVLIVLSACSSEKTEEDMIRDALSDMPPEKIAQYIVQRGCGLDPSQLERLEGETLESYLTDLYGLKSGSWTDCAVYRAGGADALEIAVIRTKSARKAKAAAEKLADYIALREADFTGYAPEQAAIVHASAAASSEYGDAALLICPDPDKAQKSFEDSYGWFFRWPFDPPGADDMTIYDTAAILDAWASGDSAGLTADDAETLDLASQALDEVIEPDMGPYERERAAYGWITAHVVYDQDHYDKTKVVDRASYTPYGPLKNGKGVCLGVASLFQLMMDMTGVECVTVIGASRKSTSDHAWNMVRLGGQWYCVDPTWDLGKQEAEWDYFNVTSEWMTGTDHQWDYETVPDAVATDGGRG